tara:strand:- start:450 stop:638 length:189 start_codon:yes stop_codon:yes gene_type:complete
MKFLIKESAFTELAGIPIYQNCSLVLSAKSGTQRKEIETTFFFRSPKNGDDGLNNIPVQTTI